MSIYRATTYPFTHDESLSFAIFTWDNIVGTTANNHVLNTALMRVCFSLFGPSEVSLRLPTLASHLGYLACSLLLLSELKSASARYLGFSVLNLNLFLLDFFFLARGYALGLAFTLLALELLRRALRAATEAPPRTYVLLWLGSLLASNFAVLANYAFLYSSVPLQLVLAVLLVRARMSVRSRLLQIAVVITCCSAAVLWTTITVLDLHRRGQLYFGGRVGFVSDTLHSLVNAFFYRYRNADAFVPIVGVIVTASFLLLIVIALISIRGAYLYRAVIAILSIAVALPVAGHALFGWLLPVERAATVYVPLYGLAISLGYDTAVRAIAVWWLRTFCHFVVVLLTSAIVWIFVTNVNVSTCYSWAYEANTKSAFHAIRDDWKLSGRGRPVEVGSSWEFNPSLNYYRLATRAIWMAPLVRRDNVAWNTDYVYAFERDVPAFLTQPHTVLAQYPDTRSVVLRLASPTGSENSVGR